MHHLHLGRNLGRGSRIHRRLASFVSLEFQAELSMIDDGFDWEHQSSILLERVLVDVR